MLGNFGRHGGGGRGGRGGRGGHHGGRGWGRRGWGWGWGAGYGYPYYGYPYYDYVPEFDNDDYSLPDVLDSTPRVTGTILAAVQKDKSLSPDDKNRITGVLLNIFDKLRGYFSRSSLQVCFDFTHI